MPAGKSLGRNIFSKGFHKLSEIHKMNTFPTKIPCQKVCWKCKHKLLCSSILCMNIAKKDGTVCGTIQPVDESTKFTAVFFPDRDVSSIKEQFNIDNNILKKVYLELQKKVHPDLWYSKSKELGEMAESQSSFVNKGFKILSDPLKRARYLLELAGHDINDNKIVDKAFLNTIFEFNISLRSSSNEERNVALANLKKLEKSTLADLEKHFNTENMEEAVVCTRKLHYISRTLKFAEEQDA